MVGYVTVEQANEYVATHYTLADKLRIGWESLGTSDKSALLLRSFETIEQLPFSGRKMVPGQPNAFPRYPDTEVPRQIIWAQIENALSFADSSAVEDAEHYGRLWQFGVKSYSIGNLSEHIGEGSWSSGAANAAASGIVSTTAARLLKPYLNGSYRIVGGMRK